MQATFGKEISRTIFYPSVLTNVTNQAATLSLTLSDDIFSVRPCRLANTKTKQFIAFVSYVSLLFQIDPFSCQTLLPGIYIRWQLRQENILLFQILSFIPILTLLLSVYNCRQLQIGEHIFPHDESQ